MKFFGNGNIGYGIALGIGAAFLVPLAARVVAGVGKPLLKESIKGGIYLVDKGKEFYAETVETFEDITAEARSEMAESKKAASAGKKAASGSKAA